MITSVIKTILIGAIIGALAFIAPFVILGFLAISLIMKLAFSRRFRHGHFSIYHLAYVEKIRSMNDEEFAGYKKQFPAHGCGTSEFRNGKATN
ncbi:MAG: hypothetical protein V1775_15775 [Bacteroidota bacterium]